jgi:hypothetical protein
MEMSKQPGDPIMADKDVYEVLVSWQLMPPMEQAVWATTFALHAQDEDGGVGEADAAVLRMRAIGVHDRFSPSRKTRQRGVAYSSNSMSFPVGIRLPIECAMGMNEVIENPA